MQFKPISNNNTLTNFSGIPCICYYPLNEDTKNYRTGTGVTDANSSLTSATINNITYRVGSGSLYSNSTSSKFYNPNIPVNSNGWTFSFWFYPTNTSSAFIFSLYSATTFTTGMNRIYMLTGTSFSIGTSLKSVTLLTITTNVWCHLAITITTGGSLIFYLNGVSTNTGTLDYHTTLPYLCLFGNAAESSAGASGYIDDFRYYDGILTQSQILQLYYYR